MAYATEVNSDERTVTIRLTVTDSKDSDGTDRIVNRVRHDFLSGAELIDKAIKRTG